jgi:hypothetical protein
MQVLQVALEAMEKLEPAVDVKSLNSGLLVKRKMKVLQEVY